MAWRRTGEKAIIWTNALLVHWRVYVVLGEDELTKHYKAVMVTRRAYWLQYQNSLVKHHASA